VRVDNLLKPALDALAGVAYVNDTQVIECLVRKVPSRNRMLRIKLWFRREWLKDISAISVAAPVVNEDSAAV
jgi:hypothetical protein